MIRWSSSEKERTRRGSLGEVVREQKTVESVLPLSLEDEIVPLGDDVRDRAS